MVLSPAGATENSPEPALSEAEGTSVLGQGAERFPRATDRREGARYPQRPGGPPLGFAKGGIGNAPGVNGVEAARPERPSPPNLLTETARSRKLCR
jgi:hypothetical protein